MADLADRSRYFDEPGPQNTEETLAAALQRAQQLGLTTLIVASDTGKTPRRALELLAEGMQLIVVTNPANVALPLTKLHDYLPRFRKHRAALVAQGVERVPASLAPQVVDELQAAGATVLRIDWQALVKYVRMDLAAIDRIGVATRVAITVALWARIAGALPPGEEVVSVAGTGFGGGGADTALVIRAGETWRDWRVLETIVRPRVSPPSER